MKTKTYLERRGANLKTISFILIIALMVTMMPIMAFADGVNVTEKVDVTGLKFTHKGTEYAIGTDGKFVGTGPTDVTVGDAVRLDINWKITADNCKQITAGNYFEIKLPTYFGFKQNSEAVTIKDQNGTPIGSFTVTKKSGDNNNIYIKLVFVDLKNFQGVNNGRLYAEGAAIAANDGTGEIIVGDVRLPQIPISPRPGGSTGTWGYINTPTTINKYGWGTDDNNLINWQVGVNLGDYFNKILINGNYSKENVVIEDNLQPGLAFEDGSFSFGMPRYFIEEKDGAYKCTNQMLSYSYLTIEEYTQQNDQSYEDFRTAIIAKNKPCYGVYDGTRLVASIKNLPNSVDSTTTWGAFSNYVNGRNMTATFGASEAAIKASTLDAYKRIFNNGNPSPDTKISIYGLYVNFKTRVTGESRSITNQAIMHYDNTSKGAVSSGYDFSQYGGGAETIPWNQMMLTKTDSTSGKTLSGVAFTLYKYDPATKTTSSGIQKYTDNSGEIKFTDLADGHYMLEETSSITGYDSDKVVIKDQNNNVITDGIFEVKQSAMTEGFQFSITNDRLDGKVVITKEDKNGNKLSGGEFGITTDGGVTFITTEKAINGTITFDELKWGEYQVVEIKAPTGYDKDKLTWSGGTTDGTFEITSTALSLTATAKNGRDTGSFELEKVDAKDGTKLNGGVFGITTDGGVTFVATKAAVDGVVSFSGLTWDEYEVVELEAPVGYDKDQLTFVNGKNFNNGKFEITATELKASVTAENGRLPGTFELEKIDAKDGAKLNGGVFGITTDGGVTFVATKAAVDGVVSFSGLTWDEYEVVELEAPAGYDKDELTFVNGENFDDGKFEITSTALKSSVTAENGRLPGEIELTKVDSASQAKLNGGVFGITTDGGVTYVATAEAIDGKVTFKNLEWGKYTLDEITAPKGYDGKLTYLNNFNGEFEIKDDSLKVEATATNKLIPEVLGDEKTPGNGNVLGEEAADDIDEEDGNVLGEEAKTSDVSNLMPVLLVMLIALAIVLIAATQNARRKE